MRSIKLDAGRMFQLFHGYGHKCILKDFISYFDIHPSDDVYNVYCQLTLFGGSSAIKVYGSQKFPGS
jgi:hypothetical protein